MKGEGLNNHCYNGHSHSISQFVRETFNVHNLKLSMVLIISRRYTVLLMDESAQTC